MSPVSETTQQAETSPDATPRHPASGIRRKLIEVAVPLDVINRASVRRQASGSRHPGLHPWWSRKPLATCRAVLFASVVDDPSNLPDEFPSDAAQETERSRLFAVLEGLLHPERAQSTRALANARREIARGIARDRGEQPPSSADEIDRYLQEVGPTVFDPFSGGGSIPLEGQRLGFRAVGCDLNPVAVLLGKALFEIPPLFFGVSPLDHAIDPALIGPPDSERRAHGLARDIRHYGRWMLEQAEARVGHLFPKIGLPAEAGARDATVTGWIWVRTVQCPNPGCRARMPLTKKWWLSRMAGREAWVEPRVSRGEGAPRIEYFVVNGRAGWPNGTFSRTGATCVACGSVTKAEYVRAEARQGRMRSSMVAVIAESEGGRRFLPAAREHEAIAATAAPTWIPDADVVPNSRHMTPAIYGFTRVADFFTSRQLAALDAFCDLLDDVRKKVTRDAVSAGWSEGDSLREGNAGARAYGEAVSVYLACALSRSADYWTTLCYWADGFTHTFGRQAVGMTWDYAELNPFSASTGSWVSAVDWVAGAVEQVPARPAGRALQRDAGNPPALSRALISTDPPYYDNVPYSDLADFFYVWLRRALEPVYPELFATLVTPKAEELVADSFRHGSAEAAGEFFEKGLHRTFQRLREIDSQYPTTVYYAFKQSEAAGAKDGRVEVVSTGWQRMIEGLLGAGYAISAVWPVHSEVATRLRARQSNALASSIVLVCRPRPVDAPTGTRREFLAQLKSTLPPALRRLHQANIAPVDLAQAAIGPGMSVYSGYAKVLDAEGRPLTVRDALGLINEILDEVLAEQEGDIDTDSRWALAWFEQHGFAAGEFGVAETLSKAKNTSVGGLVDVGILESSRGKVRLFRPEELSVTWDPTNDTRLTVWEVVHHLIRVLADGGESAASSLVAKLGSRAESARELAYRLYNICERKKRAAEALAYNGLVQSFPEIMRLAREGGTPKSPQATLFAETET